MLSPLRDDFRQHIDNFFFPRWMNVIRSDDFTGRTRRSTKMKRLDIFSYRFLPVCASPFSAFSHDPNTAIAFLSVTFRKGNCFSRAGMKRSRSLSIKSVLLSSLSPGLSVVQRLGPEKEVMSGLIIHSHPTHPMEESKGERMACGRCYSPLLACDCGLLQRTSHLQIPPRQHQAPGSMPKSTCYPKKFTSNNPL